jgi:hypothetical protein
MRVRVRACTAEAKAITSLRRAASWLGDMGHGGRAAAAAAAPTAAAAAGAPEMMMPAHTGRWKQKLMMRLVPTRLPASRQVNEITSMMLTRTSAR